MRSLKMLVFVVPILFAHSAVAGKRTQDRTANRQSLERAAKKACIGGDPGKGVDILAELYVDTNDITYIFNQGRCFEQNSRYEEALARFREYRLKGEDRLSAGDKAVVEKRIETCESYLPKPEPIKSEPVRASAALPPVPPVEEKPDQGSATAMVAVVNQPQPSEANPGSGTRIAGIVLASVGAAALITGIVLNLKVNSMASDLEKPDNFNRDTDTSRKDYKTLSWVSYGGSAAFLISGALVYYLGRRSERSSESAIVVAPSLGPHVAGAVLKGSF
jgi:hypothetical protein